MKILLIAGHGAGDPGAVCGAYREADETRNMVRLLAPILTQRGVSVGIYPTERDAFADCQKGVFRKNAAPETYDYVLEIHFNAVSKDTGDGETKGVECYVTTSEKGTGVEDALCGALSKLGLTDRRVKRRNFAVIQACKSAGTSSALLEVCFIDDADDMKVYVKDRNAVARAIADGICEGFGIDFKEAVKTEPKKVNTPSVWAKDACEWAVKTGIILGDDTGDLGWQEPVTKEQLAVILQRAMQK